MIEKFMYVALGFLLASLLALALTPPFWRRAVRLTTRRLKATLPFTAAEIMAEKDQLRAEYAVELRRVEIALAKAKDAAARHLVERNKRQALIDSMKAEVASMRALVEERNNEMRVLEQTLQHRFPELEDQLADAQAKLATRESELFRLSTAYSSQSDEFAHLKEEAQQQSEEIDRLRRALEGDPTTLSALKRLRSRRAEAQSYIEQNQRLAAELSRAREALQALKTRNEREDDLLKLEIKRLADQIMSATVDRKSTERRMGELAAATRALRDDHAQEEADALAAFRTGMEFSDDGSGDDTDAKVHRLNRPPRKLSRRRRVAARAKAATNDSSLAQRLETVAGTDS